MKRLHHILQYVVAPLAALVLVILIALAAQNARTPEPSFISGTPAATTTTDASEPQEEIETPLPAPETPTNEGEEPPPPAEELPVSTAPTPPQPAQTSAGTVAPQDVNSTARAATVNILCTSHSTGSVTPITASGVIIDPRGVILTNAHVGQYFLLTDYPTEGALSCTIRMGSPARNAYTAELLYLPPQWISDNRTALLQETPTGTGEHDYALLRISGSAVGKTVLPVAFPFLEPDTRGDGAFQENRILITGYPAGFLSGAVVLTDLYLASTQSTIGEIFTFGTQTPDLISTGGTIAAQQGSSGGAVVSIQTGKLLGLAVTSTGGGTTSERDLRALTLSYIDRNLRALTSFSLAEYLSGNVEATAHIFNETVAPTLTDILIAELQKK